MTAIAHQPHPVTRAVAGVRDQLTSAKDVPVWSMSGEETTATLTEVQAAKAQLAALEATLVAHAESIDLPGDTGLKTVNWLARHTRASRPAAHRTVRLAHGLDTHDHTRQALAAGVLHVEQAEVILKALADLPDDLDPSVVDQAESHLLDLAKDHDAKDLKALGRHVLEVLDPDAADAHEAQQLEKEEERDARAAARLTMWDDGHGKVHGRFTLPALEGAMLKKALLAFTAPKHRASQGPLGPLAERRPSPERMGQALCELISTYPANALPKAGGLNATVIVTMTLESLMGGLKPAQLDTGEQISASLARRIACEAQIIPAVLGGKSQVLDLGRSRRFHNRNQRIVATLEQSGCSADGCDEPPGRTHLHHPIPGAKAATPTETPSCSAPGTTPEPTTTATG